MASQKECWLSDVAWLAIRVMLAAVFMFHGAQKLFGYFGGPGIDGFIAGMEQMEFPLPTVSAWLAACAEFFGGVFILLGLFTRLAVVPMIITMLVASFYVHGDAFSLQHNGMEYALTLAVMLLGVGLSGGGRIAVDHFIGCCRRTPADAAPGDDHSG